METITTCLLCPVAPKRWNFSLLGVVNGTCMSCSNYNGTWILGNNFGCNWGVEIPFPHCFSGFQEFWQLYPDATNMRLELTGPGGNPPVTPQWTRPLGFWNCIGQNIMTLTPGTGLTCLNWPQFVIVNPGP